MNHAFRSFLAVGVAAMTAAGIALVPPAPSPSPTAPPAVHVTSPALRLTAGAQPLAAAASLPDLLVGWLERIVVPPSATAPFPTPQFLPAVGGTSIDSTIKNVYNAVEPWVQYGFELAAYAVGWVPYVGWLSPQILIFYHFGERIVRSITFNIADWLGGNITFGQGLINVGIDTINSFIQLGIDQWNFWLPPLPPLPPLPFAATTQAPGVQPAALVAAAGPLQKQADQRNPQPTAGVIGPNTTTKTTKTTGKELNTTSSTQDQVEVRGAVQKTASPKDIADTGLGEKPTAVKNPTIPKNSTSPQPPKKDRTSQKDRSNG